jgi:hypothetical protein
MRLIDVFNGDADGICSLLQLRLDQPQQQESLLVSGIKRDIQLLKQVNPSASDKITVLDISLDKNRSDLDRILKTGATVFYVDHHFCGDIPLADNLTVLIDTDSNICTSLLVNNHIQGKHKLWAITGAFGDNLKASAQTLVKQTDLGNNQVEQLNKLGIMLNYNGYGADTSDLHFHPESLYKHLLPYKNPLDFINDTASVFQQLESGYREDISKTKNLQEEYKTAKVALFILPDESWARRMSGVYSNELANQNPDRAHAILTHNKQGGYLISVRAPINNKTGADELCRQFETGGGRKAAAGINHLPKASIDQFIEKFTQQFA